jgi:hypothetical protein
METIKAGQTFHMWTALEDQRYPFTQSIKVECKCGTRREVGCHNLRTNRSKSCGCLVAEIAKISGAKRVKYPVNVGDRYGRLTVTDIPHRERVLCVCDCGNITQTRASSLFRNLTRSCGCLRIEQSRKMGRATAIRGGATRHTLYGTWKRITRGNKHLHRPWAEDHLLFIKEVEEEIGPRPGHLAFVMKDPTLGYIPGNITWTAQPSTKMAKPLTGEQIREIAELVENGFVQYEVAKAYDISPSRVSAIYKKHLLEK